MNILNFCNKNFVNAAIPVVSDPLILALARRLPSSLLSVVELTLTLNACKVRRYFWFTKPSRSSLIIKLPTNGRWNINKEPSNKEYSVTYSILTYQKPKLPLYRNQSIDFQSKSVD